ncbi:MAG: hypothetical protein AAGE03_07170 [Pseudomonadota bacterium]
METDSQDSLEGGAAGPAAGGLDVGIFTDGEARVLQAAVGEDDFTNQDLADLTGKSINNIRKYIHQIKGKAPDLFQIEGLETAHASGGRPREILSISEPHASILRSHFADRTAAEVGHQQVVKTLPTMQYALELLDGLADTPSEDITKRFVAQRVDDLIGRAETGWQRLKKTGRPVAEELRTQIEDARASLRKTNTELDAASESMAQQINEAVGPDADGGVFGPLETLVTRACNAFEDSGMTRVAEITTAVIGSGERRELSDQKRQIRAAWEDPIFRNNVGWVVTAAVQNAARVGPFETLAKRLIGNLRRLVPQPDRKFSDMVRRSGQTPEISSDLQETLAEAGESFLPMGLRQDSELLSADLVAQLRNA